MEGTPKVPFEEKLKLLNQSNVQVMFEDYDRLFLNEKLKFASTNFDLSIYPNKNKKDHFFRKLTTK